MENLGVITRVKESTKWCAVMVVVQKGNRKVRILCVDLTHLNWSVLRERHSLPAVEQSLVQLAGAQIFSTLDANSGFWQIPLDREPSDHIYYPVWQILLSSSTIWNQVGP